jgi:hypothetical protein
MAKNIPSVDISKDFRLGAELVKDGNLYTCPLDAPIVIQTSSSVTSSAGISPEEPFAHLSIPPGAETDFFKAAEAKVLEHCVRSREAWFKDGTTDDALQESFKSFFDAGLLKVRISDDLAVFDESKALVETGVVEAGVPIRVVLELTRACFGKTTFGAMWKLLQVQIVTPPRYLFADNDATRDAEVSDPDAREFS